VSDASGGNLPLIAVVGPTGSGKSALALALAEHLGTEIISVDSMQFYRGMEIGTAAPSHADRARVPHHFVSFLDPGEEMAAGIFQQMARAEVRRIHATGRSAVAAGGSGMYVSALIDEIFDGPGRDPVLRARLEEEARTLGNEVLLARLREVDPDYAENLTSVNDRVRIVRALEVYELSGRPYSALHREHRQHAASQPSIQFALRYAVRQDLYERINLRVLQMIDEGWVEEVQALLDGGQRLHVERLKALGYREIMAHLEGKQSLDAAIAASQMHHRRYAKRQLTWFNADPRIHWLPAGPGVGLAQQLEALLTVLENEGAPETGMHRYLQANACRE
jgi:tRNA dimethylallyltransferase